jgi:hypothetical protein
VIEQPGSVPQRIGDSERDKAAEYLREHMAQGRLDADEFDERLTVALTAKTQAQLDPLFRDLPSPRPSDDRARLSPYQTPIAPKVIAARSVPQPQMRAAAGLALASAMMWPLAIVILLASNGHLWFIMFLPFFLPWVLGQGNRRGPHRR